MLVIRCILLYYFPEQFHALPIKPEQVETDVVLSFQTQINTRICVLGPHVDAFILHYAFVNII